MVEKLLLIAANLSHSYSTEELERFIQIIIDAYDNGIVVSHNATSVEEFKKWSFEMSFLFSATAITTIGMYFLFRGCTQEVASE